MGKSNINILSLPGSAQSLLKEVNLVQTILNLNGRVIIDSDQSKIRSSCLEKFCKKVFLKFCKTHRKNSCARVSF